MRLRLAQCLLLTAFPLLPTPVGATSHLWEIKEIYSNAEGGVQYIELYCAYGSQTSLDGHEIIVSINGFSNTFQFSANIAGSTANKHLLLATPGFATIPGAVTPDFTLPFAATGNFFFDPSATGTIVIDLVGSDSVSFTRPTLPTDGRNSLTDTNLYGVAVLQSSANSPTNFAGASGTLADAIFSDGFETVTRPSSAVHDDPARGAYPATGDPCGVRPALHA